MKRVGKLCRNVGFGTALVLCLGRLAMAQSGGSMGGTSSSSTSPTMPGRDTSPLNPENSLELIKPVDRAEESAFREFQHASTENLSKKIELGEQFLKSYPQSSYRALVYSGLTSSYLMTNQVQKMQEAGEMAISLNPKDVQVLAMLGQTIPRVITASTPDPQKQLEKAERYARQAIEEIPTLVKPANVSDQEFTQAKNQTLAIAHSGLGMVDFRRGNLEGTIAELDESVTLDPRGDATNYYVLGVANYNAKHYEEAAKAFSKCSEFSGNLQATCKEGAEKAISLTTGRPGNPK
jgi:tetratricopeptide (TPR) repeat protein